MAREQPHVEDLVDNQRPLDAEGFPQVRLSVRECVSNYFSQQLAEFRSPFFKNPGFSEVTIMSIVDCKYTDKDALSTQNSHILQYTRISLKMEFQEPFHIPDHFRAFLEETPDWLL